MNLLPYFREIGMQWHKKLLSVLPATKKDIGKVMGKQDDLVDQLTSLEMQQKQFVERISGDVTRLHAAIADLQLNQEGNTELTAKLEALVGIKMDMINHLKQIDDETPEPEPPAEG